MKTKSALLTAIGALALFVLVAFPSSSALATGYCANPEIYYEYSRVLEVGMECASPTDATIFYTTNGSNPTHVGGTPGPGTSIFHEGTPLAPGWTHFKALAYHAGWGDSGITDVSLSNPAS